MKHKVLEQQRNGGGCNAGVFVIVLQRCFSDNNYVVAVISFGIVQTVKLAENELECVVKQSACFRKDVENSMRIRTKRSPLCKISRSNIYSSTSPFPNITDFNTQPYVFDARLCSSTQKI